MRILASERPDLMVLQEMVVGDMGRLAQAAGLPNYQAIRAYGPGEGGPRVGLFSRWPLQVRHNPHRLKVLASDLNTSPGQDAHPRQGPGGPRHSGAPAQP